MMPSMQRTATIRPLQHQTAGRRAAARLLRQRVYELEQEAEESQVLAVKMTPEEYKLLHDTFASVKGEFHDLDGLSWHTPQARQVLHDWHARQAVRQHSPCASPGGLRTRRRHQRRGSLSAVLSPSPSGSPRMVTIDDVVLDDNSETVRVRIRPTTTGSLMSRPSGFCPFPTPAPTLEADNALGIPDDSLDAGSESRAADPKTSARNHAVFTLAHPRKRMVKTLSAPRPHNLTLSLVTLPRPAQEPTEPVSATEGGPRMDELPSPAPSHGDWAPTPHSSPAIPHSFSAPAGLSGTHCMSVMGKERNRSARRPGMMPGIVLVCKGRGAAGKARAKGSECASPGRARGGHGHGQGAVHLERMGRTGRQLTNVPPQRMRSPSAQGRWEDVDDDEHEQDEGELVRMVRVHTGMRSGSGDSESEDGPCGCSVCRRSAAVSLAREDKGDWMSPEVSARLFVEGSSKMPM